MISSIENCRLESVIDAIEDPVRVVDPFHKVILANRAMEAAIGSSPDSLCYQGIGSSACADCITERVYRSGRSERGRRQFGDVLYDVKASPCYNDDGRITGVVEVFRDITERVSMKKRIITNQQKLDRDMMMAKKLQTSMLYRELPEAKGYRFSKGFFPCEAIGGDFLDCFYMQDGRILMYVADVSGHGLVPSMLTAFLKYEVYSIAKSGLLSASEILSRVFLAFRDVGAEDTLYITMFIAALDPATGRLEYSNAGHSVPPLIHRGSCGNTDELYLSGIPISLWVEEPEYAVGMTKMEEGDRLILYTDGLLAASDELVNKLMSDFSSDTFSGCGYIDDIEVNYRHEFADDVSILICERTGETEECSG